MFTQLVSIILSCWFTSVFVWSQSPSSVAAGGQYFETNKVKLYYQTCGSSSPAVVLLHDGLIHSVTWDEVWKPLCSRYRVLRYDRRNFGRSDAATSPFKPEEDLYQLMRHVHMDRAIVVGNSSGAGLAVDFAVAHPEMVDGLFLIGPVVHGMPTSDFCRERGNKNNAPLDNHGDVRGAAENWSKDRFLIANGHEEARKKLYETLINNPQNLRKGGRFEIQPSPPTVSRLTQIQAPTLVVTGESDIADVFMYSGALEAALPVVWVEVWKDTGHLIQLERPDELVARINKFALLAERKEASVSSETLQTYVGEYQFFQRTLGISLKGNRLAIRTPDMPEKPLFAASESRFFVRTTGTEIEFEKDASGRITQMVVYNSDGNVIRCARIQ